jgi:hypothetical protein
MEERPLPPPPKGLSVVLVISFSLLAILFLWLWLRHPFDLLHPLPGILAFALVLIPLSVIRYFYFNRRRCPECGSHLVLRRELKEGTRWQYRMMLDCSRCQIAWDTGDTEDDSPSA